MAIITSNVNQIDLHKAVNLCFRLAELRLQRGIRDLSTPYLAGPPGGGKTKSLQSGAEKRGLGFVTRNMGGLSRIEKMDGIPKFSKVVVEDNGRSVQEMHTKWSVPEMISEIRGKSRQYKYVMVLLDDWHIAIPPMQAIGYQLFTDYAIGEHKIPHNAFFVLAGNDTPANGAKATFPAIMNRIAKYHVRTNLDYWLSAYAHKKKLYDPILTFLMNTSYKHLFHGNEDPLNPWPSPRSWTNLSSVLSALDLSDFVDSELDAIIAAHIGASATSEFSTYLNVYLKINAQEQYVTGNINIPNDSLDRFSYTFAMSSEFLNQCGINKGQAYTVYAKLLKSLQKDYPELASASLKYIVNRDQDTLVDLFRQKAISSDLALQLKQITSYISRERKWT